MSKPWKPSKPMNGGMVALGEDIAKMSRESNGFVLEIGAFTGSGSTVAIQDGLCGHPNPLHITVDWDEQIDPEYRPTVPWWHFVKGDSRSDDTLRAVITIAAGRSPGIIFLDTDHSFLQMQAELALWGQIAHDDTVWLFHDSWMYGVHNSDMVKAITDYANQFRWIYDDYRTDSHGLGRMRR